MIEANIYGKAIYKWGVESQMFMAMEEMAELTQALSKHWRGKGNPYNLREEIADVEIMMAQMRIIFDSFDGKDTIDEIKKRKLARLENLVSDKPAPDAGMEG